MKAKTRTFKLGGMHCEGCATIIQEAVARLPGIEQAHADYQRETLTVACLPKTSSQAVVRAVETQGYQCSVTRPRRSWLQAVLRTVAVILALALMAALLTEGDTLAARLQLPELDRNMSYGMLFLVGLFTGVHCIGMCGGFIVGYTTQDALHRKRSHLLSHLLYGVGKTLSYALLGGLFGLLGALVTFTPAMRGLAAVVAGLFLVLFGLNMLGWFRSLHVFHIRMPRFLGRFLQSEVNRPHSPFVIGLLNGLMIACGPLQAMYVMAAGTGQFWEGAKLLLIFGLGTLPALFGFAALTSLVSGSITQGLLKVSAVLVMALGLIMVNRGLLLSGSGYDFRSLATLAQSKWLALKHAQQEQRESPLAYQEIHMTVTSTGYQPDRFVLKQGVPVHWIIDGQELNACNKAIVVPSLGLAFEIKPGQQTIEFTPTQAGIIPWSCWMGMIPGTFLVEPAGTPPP